jgi:hypothetical protein
VVQPSIMKRKLCLAAVLPLIFWLPAQSQEKEFPGKNWAGTWRGPLTNLPARAGAASIEVTMEIGRLPTSDNSCATWRSTYKEGSEVLQVKDFRFCRGTGADDLYIDEGDGTRLTARWLGNVLVSPFKYDNFLLISTMRLRDEILEHEIISVDDKPAIQGVVPMHPRSIQRIELRRVPL